MEACLFGHVGEFGVEFGHETVGGVLSSNIFRSMAFGAFKMWQNNQINNLQERSGWAHIHNNDVLGFATYWFGGVGILTHECVFNTIENNHVRGAPHNGINASGGGRLLRFGFSNTVRNNRVHDIGQGVLSDLAAIRISGKSPHSYVEGNVVHDVNARDYGAIHVYLDGESEYWTVRDNWFYRTNERSMNMKGWSHKIENNILAFAGDHLVNRRNSDTKAPFSDEFPLLERVPPEFEHNIFALEGAGITYIWVDYEDIINPWAYSDHNLFWDMTADIWVGGIRSGLDEFRDDQEMDLNSLQTDPMFINPHRGDFRLHPDSPAVTELGVTSVDNRSAGINEAVWNEVGAVWYRTEPVPEPEWLPSDIPGLMAWWDAADYQGQPGPLHHWDTKTPYTFLMRQYDTDHQPVVITDARKGLPVVRFSDGAWMGTHEHSWRTRRHSGQFQDRGFTIIAASSAIDANQVLLSKGNEPTPGQWQVGDGNNLRWNNVYHFGGDDEDFAIRTWRRGTDGWEYHVNGQPVATATDDFNHIFDSEEILFLGGDGNGNHFEGDIAEILIFQGHLSDSDLHQVHEYLGAKWNPHPDGIQLTEGSWTNDPRFGTLFGVNAQWAYSPFMGWIRVDLYPFLYHSNLGWLYFAHGTDEPGQSLWFYSPDEWQWVHIGPERDGYFESSLHPGSRFPLNP